MSVQIKKHKNVTWLNIEEPTEADINYLRENFKFHTLDLEDLGHEAQRSKLDIYSDYAFIILRFPVTYKDSNLIGSHELGVFLGKDYVITIQKKKIISLQDYHRKVMANEKLMDEVFGGRPALLLYNILDEMYHATLSLTDWLMAEINQVEKEVYDEETKTVVKALALLRRNVLTFKSIMEPQRLVIRALVNLQKDYLSKEFESYFDDIADYIERIHNFVETSKELVDGLHATNESLSSYRLNRVMKILTIFSVSLLPLTLLTGIWGMNLQSLPLIHDETLVWYIFGGLAAVIVGIFVWLKKKNII
ncbi:MAG: magnesium transporter CorA family protein [Candidatus Komeilibacteria bacterium]|nr:magnesium transporter CorA family protein [Candidatus Komeilibacteria bacterium]